MRAVKTTLLEIIILIVVGTGLAFTVNAVRAKGSLKVTKDHFDKGRPVAITDSSRQPAKGREALSSESDSQEMARSRGSEAAEPAHRAAAPTKTEAPQPTSAEVNPQIENKPAEASQPPKEGGHIQHDYQSISLKDVIDVFNDPLTAKGLNVFVDARNDQHFEEGHIPGAVQFDPYHVEQYLDAAVAKANAAEKVIVYCNGGDCEDSIYACRELLTAGIPYESIFLFEGGWKEWSAEQPISKGREE